MPVMCRKHICIQLLLQVGALLLLLVHKAAVVAARKGIKCRCCVHDAAAGGWVEFKIVVKIVIVIFRLVVVLWIPQACCLHGRCEH